MSIAARIKQKLQILNPVVLEIINNSALHRHHLAMRGKVEEESHFKLKIVSKSFENLKLIQRHRLVNKILEEEYKVVHAMELELKTEDEISK
jgi:stress-induced morphogen